MNTVYQTGFGVVTFNFYGVWDIFKKYRIRIYAPNKNRKMNEQAENLKHLLEKVDNIANGKG